MENDVDGVSMGKGKSGKGHRAKNSPLTGSDLPPIQIPGSPEPTSGSHSGHRRDKSPSLIQVSPHDDNDGNADVDDTNTADGNDKGEMSTTDDQPTGQSSNDMTSHSRMPRNKSPTRKSFWQKVRNGFAKNKKENQLRKVFTLACT